MARRSPIPEAALAMHMAILATSGAGKTVTAKGAVEDLLERGERTAIIDPTGVWHGLRTLANGKHAGNNLVSGGRARGIAVTLISQRASKLHKDSLTQVQTLVAMQNVHALDRATVVDFVKGYAGKDTADQIESSLASLQTGEGWIYSPKLGVLDRTRFPMIRTLDTSDRPKPGEKRAPPATLAKVDLKAIAKALAPPENTDVITDGITPGAKGKKDAGKTKTAPVKTYTGEEFAAFGDQQYRVGFANGRRAERNDTRRLFASAFAALPAIETFTDKAPPTREQREAILAGLNPIAGRMLDALERTPAGLTSKQLAVALKVRGDDGRWYRSLKELKRTGLIAKRGEKLIAPHAGKEPRT